MFTQFHTFHAIQNIITMCTASASSLESAESNTSPHSLPTCVLSSSEIIWRREMYAKTLNSYSNNRISYHPFKFPSHFNIGDSVCGEAAPSFLSRRNRIITWQGVFSPEYKRQVAERSLSPCAYFFTRVTTSRRNVRWAVCSVQCRCFTLDLLLS